MSKTTVNERIKIFIESKNLAQNEFSALTKLSQGAVSRLLNGETSPFGSTLQKITKAFPDLNEDWLRTGNGDMLQTPTKVEGSITNDMYEQLKMDLEMYRAMCAKLMGIEPGKIANFLSSSLSRKQVLVGEQLGLQFPNPYQLTLLVNNKKLGAVA